MLSVKKVAFRNSKYTENSFKNIQHPPFFNPPRNHYFLNKIGIINFFLLNLAHRPELNLAYKKISNLFSLARVPI